MKTSIITILLFGFCQLPISAQSSSLFIDSLKITPSSPIAGDSITLYAYIIITWGTPVNIKYDETLNVSDSIISASSCYLLGANPEAFYVTDTFPLGIYNAGNYKIRYILKEPFDWEVDSPQECRTYQYYDSAFLNFTVQPISAVNEITAGFSVSVYPNPSATTLNVLINDCKSENSEATISDITGSKVLSTQYKFNNGTNRFTIDIATLEQGIYFLEVTNGDRKEQAKIIVCR